jgi:sugar O-acyltransferase (sialic acid O-acetyltransferase NeuD family)
MKGLIGVYGAGGCGRGILPLLRNRVSCEEAELVFIDDGIQQELVNGQRVMNWSNFISANAQGKSVCLAVSEPRIRRALWDKCQSSGISICSVSAESVVIMDHVEIGAGHCLSPFVTLTANIKIGKAFHANLYSYVEHDCVIGDFVTFAPGVQCNGNVVVEDLAYVGAGAMIKQGTPEAPIVIGRSAVVGMGAVVTESVSAGQTVVGNPARPLR